MKPSVSRIRIYPFKSLDPLELNEVTVGQSSLLHDREFAMINAQGKFVNGKSTQRVNQLRSVFDLENFTVRLNEEGKDVFETFSLTEDKEKLENYLAEFLGYPVTVVRNLEGRFQDIPVEAGITILSEESLSSLTHYFPEISLDQMRRRFRANIEVTNVEAFWEDHLFTEPGSVIEYEINDIKLFGISPRERCIVPTRDSTNGETYPKFTKKFVEARKDLLPEWSELPEYGHYYFLTVDTFIPDSERGKIIRVGDELKITGKRQMSKVKH